MGAGQRRRNHFWLSLHPEASSLFARFFLSLPESLLVVLSEREGEKGEGKTFSDDEFIVKHPAVKPDVSEDPAVSVDERLIIRQSDSLLIKVEKRKPLGQLSAEINLFSRVIELSRVNADKPNSAIRTVRKPNLNRIAVVHRENSTGVRERLCQDRNAVVRIACRSGENNEGGDPGCPLDNPRPFSSVLLHHKK